MKNQRLIFIISCFFIGSAYSKEKLIEKIEPAAKVQKPVTPKVENTGLEKALFAGGCFWCMEPPFEKLENKGVIEARSGFSGGRTANPTYEEVSKSNTGHFEVVEITFDPKKITYAELVEVFWKNIDPLDGNGQFCDKGESYKSAIFYLNEEQKKVAEVSLGKLIKSNILKEKIVTEILPAKTFYAAEDYHQDYYKKNPIRYKYYRNSCGRDKRLKELWGPAN